MSYSVCNLRIGQGFDVHAFAEGRELILGGVHIPYELGLLGHSDADVLLHALTDAVLGALSWGDIGQWFPDTESQFKDISSRILLREVWEKARAERWRLVNCDCVVLAEAPKLAPYMERMRRSIAELLTAGEDQVSVKATTTERLGFVGRKEGIAAATVVLLQKESP